jgi:hypothetical protein
MMALMVLLACAGIALTFAYVAGFGAATPAQAIEPAETPIPAAPPSTTMVAETTTTTVAGATTTTGGSSEAPVAEPRYLVPPDESEPDAKQLAADIAHALTTYDEFDDATTRFAELSAASGVAALAEAAAPLTHEGRWSRGEVIYPQLGGLTDEKTSVMVVTRQTVGTGPDADHTIVRTIDIRLVRGVTGWEFDELASAGGVFDSIETLRLAHAVADDPRIELTDSARLDIRAGEISPVLLELMAELAERTPFAATVLKTGHPYHVFETDRVSHHTTGRAIDIYRIDGLSVIDDRDEDSATRELVAWFLENSNVHQVGSPWDLDGPDSRRSFSDVVHADHIHIAVED